jgi:pimeloyl-ACP methyl ester carboxylesterase
LLSLAIAGCGTLATPTATPQEATNAQAHAVRSIDAFMDEVFTVADTDKSKTLSLKESDLLLEQFQVFDQNHDGQLSKGEWQAKGTFGQVMKALPLFLPMVLSLHTQMDANRNRLVSLGEVKQALGQGRSLLGDAQVEDTFRASDKNQDGGLNGDEFQTFYLDVNSLPTERGLFRKVVMSLLGTYLSVMSRIAAPKAIHPSRNIAKETPSRWGWAYDDVTLKTEDGLKLKAWYVPAKNPTKKTLVMVHGISDNRGWFVRMGVLPMVHDDYNVLAFDLRNHGESDGTATSFGYHEGKDVVAAVRWLEQEKGTDQIALYGVSLGGASVIRGAAILPEVKAVIDDCAYATVAQAFAGFISLTFIPCPVLIARSALVEANRQLGVDMTTTEPLTQIGKIAPRPLLVMHGAEDKNVPVDNSRVNYAAAGENLHKELWIVPGGEHAASAVAQPADYKAHLQAFLKQVNW